MKKIFFLIVMSFNLLTSPAYSENNLPELIHDPSKLFSFDDRLFGYASGIEGQALSLFEFVPEENLIEFLSPVFDYQESPQWASDFQKWNKTGEFDAPSITNDGKHIFYTVYDEKENLIQDAIGLVVNNGTPDEPGWEDLGLVIQSEGEDFKTARCMDPSIIEDQDRIFMVFGSQAGGIYLTELNPDTMKLAKNPTRTSTAVDKHRFINLAKNFSANGEEGENEAAYIHKNGKFYYLFVNWGSCCNGIDSTYHIIHGRALSISGPYLDKNGVPLTDGGGSLFLGNEGRYIGPGHIGILESEKLGDIVSYHFYDSETNGISNIAIRELTWDSDGWPVLGDHLFFH